MDLHFRKKPNLLALIKGLKYLIRFSLPSLKFSNVSCWALNARTSGMVDWKQKIKDNPAIRGLLYTLKKNLDVHSHKLWLKEEIKIIYFNKIKFYSWSLLLNMIIHEKGEEEKNFWLIWLSLSPIYLWRREAKLSFTSSFASLSNGSSPIYKSRSDLHRSLLSMLPTSFPSTAAI